MTIGLLFSPQGSQAVGMGRELAASSSSAAGVYDEVDAAAGWKVSELCWNGPAERLNDTRQTQPCLLATSVASLRALVEAAAAHDLELQPAYAAGHSVGEYAALVASGVLSLEDALALVIRRGELMAEAGVDGGMSAVIGLDRDVIAETVAPIAGLVVANDNAPGQVVVSGSHAALAAAAEPLQRAGARRIIPLNVSGPFHSPLMVAVGHELATAFDGVRWHEASPPLVSNVTAEPVSRVEEIRDLLARQVSSPVEWVRSVRRMVADGVDTFIECGPGAALTGMIRRIAPHARTLNVADPAGVAAAVAAVGGVAAATEASA
jgi:[acyl-carrier-protein] S-malonyltransferase